MRVVLDKSQSARVYKYVRSNVDIEECGFAVFAQVHLMKYEETGEEVAVLDLMVLEKEAAVAVRTAAKVKSDKSEEKVKAKDKKVSR